MEMMPGFSTDSVKSEVGKMLRLYVGHGRHMSWAELAEATGDGERRLRSYVELDGPLMPLDVFVRVCAALPPEAFARLARFMGFAAAPVELDSASTVRRVLAQAARLVADGNEYLEAGTINPRDQARLAEGARELLPGLQSLADTGSRT